MRIESIRIQNLRGFRDEAIFFDNYTCLVGANGAGKSTILFALNVFFRESSGVSTDVISLDEQDFHKRNIHEPIHITITFCDLSTEAKEDFKDYVRLDKLIVSAKAEYDPVKRGAIVKQYGQRLVMQEFSRYFEASKNGKSAADLKAIFLELRENYPDIAEATTKESMATALRDYESRNSEKCVLISSEDEFYGISKGKNRLEKHVQWVYVPAVKDASDEESEGKDTALGRLLMRTVRSKVNFGTQFDELKNRVQIEYQDILKDHEPALSELESMLSGKISDWAHPGASLKLNWQASDPKKSVQISDPIVKTIAGEGMFQGDIARFGHGLQRSYLLALLQILMVSDDINSPTLILGCEEPELYQHPPQIKHLSEVLQKLAEVNSQIIVTTHNPIFVSGKVFESVRLVCKNQNTDEAMINFISYENFVKRYEECTGKRHLKPYGMLAKLHQILQPSISEMLFASHIVLVEGLEDVAYVTSWMMLSGRWEKFRRRGFHLIAMHSKSELLLPLILLQEMKIPCFVIFDADGDCKKEEHRQRHEHDNTILLKTLNGNFFEPFPSKIVLEENHAVWPTNLGEAFFTDIPDLHHQSIKDRACAAYDNAGGLEKNSLYIATKLKLVWDDGFRPNCLESLCDKILQLA